MVGFGNSYAADVCGYLAYEGLVDAAYNYFVCAGALKLYACNFGNFNGMGITYVENYLAALLCNLPADAVYFERLLVAFGYAHNHVVEKRPVKAVFGVELFSLVLLEHVRYVTLYLDIDVADYLLGERALCALYGESVAFERYGYACGKVYG